MTEYLCAGFSCVLLGHVEAALQYKIDPISQYVCFLEFASVTFVIVVPSSRNMKIRDLMFKAIPASGRGKWLRMALGTMSQFFLGDEQWYLTVKKTRSKYCLGFEIN